MKLNKYVSMAFYVLLMLLLGNVVQAQSQVSRKSSKKVLKQEQATQQEINHEEIAAANETALEAGRGKRKGRNMEKGDRARKHKTDHPGQGHAYGKYKDKKAKANNRRTDKNKQGKAAKKAKEEVGKQKMEKRKIGKAYSKSRKTKSSKAKVKRTSRADIPVQEN